MQLIFTNRVYVALGWITLIMIGCIAIKRFRQLFLRKINFNIIVIVMTYFLSVFVICLCIVKESCLKEIMWQPVFMMIILSLPRKKEGNIKAIDAIKIFVLAVFMLAPHIFATGIRVNCMECNSKYNFN